MGHWFLEDLRDMAGLDGIAPRVAEDWNTVAGWLGVAEDSEKWRAASEEDRAKMWKNAHEKFAASFEQYCFEGKAPSNALKKAFRAFKKWLLDIYKAVAGIRYRDADGNRVAFQINDDIRGVLGRMLAAEEAAENAADEMGVTEVAEAADRKGKSKGKKSGKGKAGSGIIDCGDLSNAEAERVGKSVVVVTGNEFGDFDLSEHGSEKFKAELKRLRKAAAEFYGENIQGTYARHPDARIQRILFTGRGARKAISNSANPDKLKLFAKLPELVESSIVDGEPEIVKHSEKHPDVVRYWRLKSSAVIDGVPVDVNLLAEEYKGGKIYYNHHVDVKKSRRLENSGTSETDILPPSGNGLDRSIIPQPDVGSNNLNILSFPIF
ncbi:hypothetical protein FACS1894216_22380 [Synergistales bacterium]|nr:hypothetical protein FACS1894216_22380 [Synergistales bacterium]